MAVEWLKKFTGDAERLIAEFTGEKGEEFKLMATFFIESRLLDIRKVLPPLLAAAFVVRDGNFAASLLKEANLDDVAEMLRILRRGVTGVGINKRVRLTIQEWLYSKPSDWLELQAISSAGAANYIIDLIHSSPDKFKLKWWQSHIFGEEAPKDSLIAQYKKIQDLPAGKRLDFLRLNPVPWEYLLYRIFPDEIPEDVIEVTIEKAPFMYLMHFLSRLVSSNPKLNKNLAGRIISSASDASFNFGLVLKKYLDKNVSYPAEIQAALMNASQVLLENTITPEFRTPVFIIGDQSSSMSQSIQGAVLLAGVIAQKIFDGDLSFFNTATSKYRSPKDISQVLQALKDIRATGSTNIAEALARASKQNAKTIILISDGGHNTPTRNIASDIKQYGVDPKLGGIDLFFIRVSGDFDLVWEHFDPAFSGRSDITRLIDLREVNVSELYGFLKILLQLFNYDPSLDAWKRIASVKNAFLIPESLPGEKGVATPKTCTICGEEVSKETALLLACGHRYHDECIKRYWKLLDGSKRCVFNCVTRVTTCINCGGEIQDEKCKFCGASYTRI
nr:hypothetical protein [Candidatus Sigynarchaeota archaeon]